MCLTKLHKGQVTIMNRITVLESNSSNGSNHSKAESQVWEEVRDRTQSSPNTSPQRTGYVPEQAAAQGIPTIQTMKASEMVNRRVQERLDELENAADNLYQIPGSTVPCYNNPNQNKAQFNGYNDVVSPPPFNRIVNPHNPVQDYYVNDQGGGYGRNRDDLAQIDYMARRAKSGRE